MSDRDLMQQALEALDVLRKAGELKLVNAAIESLRARLAGPVAEPVAWRFKPMVGSLWSVSDDGYYISCKKDKGYIVEPLYTAPPTRRPLTDEEIIDAVNDADLDWAKGWTLDETHGNRFATLARNIERAHNITGGKDE